jgi:microcystin-dependent protein
MGNLNLGAQASDAPLTGSAILDGSINLAELAQSLRNFLVPIGAVLPYAGAGTAPSGFLYCDGALHDVSGTCATCGLAHSALATALSNAYGGTSGVSFRVPDLRGRVPLGVGAGGGDGGSGTTGSSPAGATPALTTRVRGEWGGAQTHTLTTPQIPAHAHGINPTDINHTHSGSTGGASTDHSHPLPQIVTTNAGGTTGLVYQGARQAAGGLSTGGHNVDHSHGFTTGTMNSNWSHAHTMANAGGDQSHNNVQPYVAVNYIIKAI